MEQGDEDGLHIPNDVPANDGSSEAYNKTQESDVAEEGAPPSEEASPRGEPVADPLSAFSTPESPSPGDGDNAAGTEEPPTEEADAATGEEAEAVDQEPDETMPEAEVPPMDNSGESEGTEPTRQQLGEPLQEGDLVGPYAIERLFRSTPDERRYLAVGIHANGDKSSFVTLIERVEGGFSTPVSRLIAMRLRHPRLLVPRALFPDNGRDYLVVENLIGEDGNVARLVSEGGRLPTINTITAGAGLADALSYLHRNSFAHLHISSDTVVIFNGRAYLIGLEQASYFDLENPESASLVARDANFLARTMAIIGDVPEEEVPGEDLLQDNLRRIAAHGTGGGFESPGELAGACGAALESVTHALPDLGNVVPASITLEIGSATTIGRVRSQNQDASASVSFDITDDRSHGEPVGVYLVADGMGGEARGEWASRIAARLVVAEMASHFALPSVTRAALELEEESPAEAATENDSTLPPTEDLTQALVQAVERANQQVRELAERLGKVTGTTLTAIAVEGQHASMAHLGDSRAYLLRGDMMVKLTEDHSVLAKLQALDHPILNDPDMFVPRNTLYRSLGQDEETVPDTLEFMLAPGDRLLICSDGLWDELEAQTLAQTLVGSANPRDCAEQLVQMANAAGGSDNSTALAIFVHAVAGDKDRLAATGA